MTDASKDEEKAARIRKLNLESDRIELELAKENKKVIEVSKVTQIWSKVLSEFKSNILIIPKQISAVFDTFQHYYDLEDALNRALLQALDNLSRTEYLVEETLGNE